jgi:hypothetical protein
MPHLLEVHCCDTRAAGTGVLGCYIANIIIVLSFDTALMLDQVA